jgi:PP-loop superfamily ATP-utilizing enzyme
MSSDPPLEAKEARLREILRAHAPLLVAYSGGVDSTPSLF